MSSIIVIVDVVQVNHEIGVVSGIYAGGEEARFVIWVIFM